MTTARARDVVRMPVRVRSESSRTLDQRIALRLPSLAVASARAFGRLSPASPLRKAIVRRTVQAGAEAYNRRDLSAVAINYHPDIEYYPYREFVEAGLAEPCYRGRDGYRAYIQATYDVWGTDVRLELTEVIDLGERIVMLADMPMRAQASGIALDQRYAGVSTLHEGLVVRQQDFLDEAEALASVGLGF